MQADLFTGRKARSPIQDGALLNRLALTEKLEAQAEEIPGRRLEVESKREAFPTMSTSAFRELEPEAAQNTTEEKQKSTA